MSITDTLAAINEMYNARMVDVPKRLYFKDVPTVADLKDLAAAYTELLMAAKGVMDECLPVYEAKEPLERLEKAIQNRRKNNDL
jgi:hypothetical protein